MSGIELLEQTGFLRLLLLLEKRKYYVTELKKSEINPTGIGSLETVSKIRDSLKALGLIEEYSEERPPFKTFLIITDKGRIVVQKIHEIQQVLLAQSPC